MNCPGSVPEGIVTDDLVDFSDFMPTLATISGTQLPNVELDGRSFWPQCLGKRGSPRQWIFQYYYPKLAAAGEKHGQGVNGLEVIWAQNQHFKLYRDATLYAVVDRHETTPIRAGNGSQGAEDARKLLQRAIDSMPDKAAKLSVKIKQND